MCHGKSWFICEGDTEKIIIESPVFRSFLKDNQLEFLKAFDATGNGNLLPENIKPMINNLLEEGAEKIFVLTDLDNDACITKTKLRINAPESLIVIVAIQLIESWFLADNKTMSAIFNENFSFTYPESAISPRQILKDLFIKKTGRGIGDSKPKFAIKMINNGFSILNAAAHPNCSSATYFIDKLQTVN